MEKKKNDTSKSLVDPTYVERVFLKLEKMIVELDEDPLEFGPSRLSKKIKECRSFLNSIESEALACSRELHKIKENHRAASRLYKLDEDKLLADDPEVRAGRSIDDRRAVARLKLPTEVAELTWMEQGMEDLDTVLGWLKYKQSGIRNTQSQLKEQRNLCNEEIGLGRTWRNKNLPSVSLTPGQGRSSITQDVDNETNRILDGLGDADGGVDVDELLDGGENGTEAEEENGDDTDDGELVPGITPDPSEDEKTEDDPAEDSTTESPDTLPPEPTDDPSEKGESSEVDIAEFFASPDESEPKPTDSDAAETDELDIDELLSGLG